MITSLAASVVILAALASPATPSSTLPVDHAGCTTSTIVTLRGSGETQARAKIPGPLTGASDGFEGPTIRRALVAVLNMAASSKTDLSSYKLLNIGPAQGYHAISVGDAAAQSVAKALGTAAGSATTVVPLPKRSSRGGSDHRLARGAGVLVGGISW